MSPSPPVLDTQLHNLMLGEVPNPKTTVLKGVLPCLLEDHLKIWAIYRDLPFHHSSVELLPDDGAHIQSHLGVLVLLAKKQHVHQVVVNLIQISNTRKQRSSEDPMHDIQKRNENH